MRCLYSTLLHLHYQKLWCAQMGPPDGDVRGRHPAPQQYPRTAQCVGVTVAGAWRSCPIREPNDTGLLPSAAMLESRHWRTTWLHF